MPKDTPFDDARIDTELAAHPAWYRAGGTIARRFDTDGWPTTLMLVNAIGFLAEAADHHPDLEVSWGRVIVKLSTHSAGGITGKDFALAREIERIALWRPEPGGALAGTRKAFVKST
jgi:4a-hydroxytetrahydrobiopterin dehydratase